MKEIIKNELIKKINDFHVVFVVESDLSTKYSKPENIDNLGELGYAISRDFKTGILWIKNKEKFIYDNIEGRELNEIKKLYMHHTISSKSIRFELWVDEI